MRVVFNTGEGTSMGSVMRISEVVVSVYNTGALKYGLTMSDLKDVTLPSTPYTGDVVITPDTGFDVNTDLYLSSDSPLPLTVRAIIPRIHKTGR